MKISARAGVSFSEKFYEFDLDELGCKSEDEWNNLTESMQEQAIQDAVDSDNEQPYLIVENWRIK